MTRKNGVKRLLMYAIVLIGALFVGSLAYYFAKNNETIALAVQDGEIIYVNKGQVINFPIKHTQESKSTTIEATSSNVEVASVSNSAKTITANSGGVVTIKITTSNKNFGPYTFDVFVGDGSVDNPWYISSATQLAKIGKPDQSGQQIFETNHHYEIINDINLANQNNPVWTPIAEFSGSIRGEGHTLNNLKIESASANVGFVGKLTSGAIIENIMFRNVSVYASNGQNVGVIAGINSGTIGKVEVTGNIYSSNSSAYVGGIAGKNKYEGTRPVINMTMVNLSYFANGSTGAVVGHNLGGIVFNSSVNVLDIDAFELSKYQATAYAAVQYDTPIDLTNFKFGGIVAKNEALVYEEAFRQAAIKSVMSIIHKASVLERAGVTDAKIALAVYENDDIPAIVHQYKRKNEYNKLTVRKFETSTLFAISNSAETLEINQKTLAELTAGTAPSEFGFSEVWYFNPTSLRYVLRFDTSYEHHHVGDPGNVLANADDIIDAFKNIIENEAKTYNYVVEISEDITIDVAAINTRVGRAQDKWVPIGTKQHPYAGQFVVNGGKIIFENLNVKYDNEIKTYYGFFGYVNGGSMFVNNFSFVNTIIEVNPNLSGQTAYAGVLAAYVELGNFENIEVDAANLSNALTAGFVVGELKSGSIKNAVVGGNEVANLDNGDSAQNLIVSGTSSVYEIAFGGIVGKTGGILENVEVHYVEIINDSTSPKISFFGGIAGRMLENSRILESRNLEAFLRNFVSAGYYGGIAGSMANNSLIYKSFSKGEISALNPLLDESVAGGITAITMPTSSIELSFSNASIVKAKVVGGIVGINFGKVLESYSAGEYVGHDVGGLSFANMGDMKHVYTVAILTSTSNSKDNTVAGLSVYLPKNGSIQFAFSSATINATGNAKKWAETKTEIRKDRILRGWNDFWSGRLFQRWSGTLKVELDGIGTLTNYIVINYGSALVQTKTWDMKADEFIKTDEDSVRGNGAGKPFEQAGMQDFSPYIWKFGEGNFPVLVRCVADPDAI